MKPELLKCKGQKQDNSLKTLIINRKNNSEFMYC
jgi:hypothetical protein